MTLQPNTIVRNVSREDRERIFKAADEAGVKVVEPTRRHESLDYYPHVIFANNKIGSCIDSYQAAYHELTVEQFIAALKGAPDGLLPFDWEAYQSGKYEAVWMVRKPYPVIEQLHLFEGRGYAGIVFTSITVIHESEMLMRLKVVKRYRNVYSDGGYESVELARAGAVVSSNPIGQVEYTISADGKELISVKKVEG